MPLITDMITENIVIHSNYSWIDIEHPLKIDLEFLKNEFSLPLLLVQDCLKPAHLPKFERTENGYFLLLRSFDPTSKDEDITAPSLTNKIAIFITDKRLITIHNQELLFLRRFADSASKVGFPDNMQGLSHQIIRSVIMTYEEPLAKLQKHYEEFEHEVLSRSTETLSTNRVYQFRRQLFVLRVMLRQIQTTLLQSKEFWTDYSSLLQDLKEDIEQLYFRLDDISHNFDQLFALYLSINEQRNNNVMKILTVFASIMLPLTFVASFYGMNFTYLPGKHSVFGLWVITLIMLIMTLITIWYFKRKGWFNPTRQ